ADVYHHRPHLEHHQLDHVDCHGVVAVHHAPRCIQPRLPRAHYRHEDGSSHYSLLFFFSSRRRHTRCLSDWSSDVCSSDLNWPTPFYEEQTVDMKDVYAECEKKYGKPIDLAVKSTYNPKTKKYFGFSPSFTPDPINWRKDLWDEVGVDRKSVV